VMRDARAFARLFGWRTMARPQADALKRTFLAKEAEALQAQSVPVHVRAAAAAGQFARISNPLAVEHALLILHYLDDAALVKRLSAFQLCDEAGAVVPIHWTTPPKRMRREKLPADLVQ
jgi:hypothetical protein